jgi:hypothetical protein
MIAVFCTFVVCLAVVNAEDFTGKVKKVDADKNTILISVNDKDQSFTLTKDTKIVALFGKKANKAQLLDLPGGLTSIKDGMGVTITTDKVDSKQVVTQVKLDELQPKKKKKAN